MHSHLLHVVKLKFWLTPFDTLTNTLDSLYQPCIPERVREGLADTHHAGESSLPPFGGISFVQKNRAELSFSEFRDNHVVNSGSQEFH